MVVKKKEEYQQKKKKMFLYKKIQQSLICLKTFLFVHIWLIPVYSKKMFWKIGVQLRFFVG
jgi:hypothetical protein